MLPALVFISLSLYKGELICETHVPVSIKQKIHPSITILQ